MSRQVTRLVLSGVRSDVRVTAALVTVPTSTLTCRIGFVYECYLRTLE